MEETRDEVGGDDEATLEERVEVVARVPDAPDDSWLRWKYTGAHLPGAVSWLTITCRSYEADASRLPNFGCAHATSHTGPSCLRERVPRTEKTRKSAIAQREARTRRRKDPRGRAMPAGVHVDARAANDAPTDARPPRPGHAPPELGRQHVRVAVHVVDAHGAVRGARGEALAVVVRLGVVLRGRGGEREARWTPRRTGAARAGACESRTAKDRSTRDAPPRPRGRSRWTAPTTTSRRSRRSGTKEDGKKRRRRRRKERKKKEGREEGKVERRRRRDGRLAGRRGREKGDRGRGEAEEVSATSLSGTTRTPSNPDAAERSSRGCNKDMKKWRTVVADERYGGVSAGRASFARATETARPATPCSSRLGVRFPERSWVDSPARRKITKSTTLLATPFSPPPSTGPDTMHAGRRGSSRSPGDKTARSGAANSPHAAIPGSAPTVPEGTVREDAFETPGRPAEAARAARKRGRYVRRPSFLRLVSRALTSFLPARSSSSLILHSLPRSRFFLALSPVRRPHPCPRDLHLRRGRRRPTRRQSFGLRRLARGVAPASSPRTKTRPLLRPPPLR